MREYVFSDILNMNSECNAFCEILIENKKKKSNIFDNIETIRLIEAPDYNFYVKIHFIEK